MQRSGIGLKLQHQFFSRLRFRTKKDVPVVHVDSLYRFPVHKQQKLRILRIVPLVDLGTYMKPHALSVKRLRHPVERFKPVMPVLPVPVHMFAVKSFPCPGIRLRLFRMDIISFLIFPAPDRETLFHFQFFQFFTNDVRSLV